jgi:hypothetical protein
MGCCTRCHELAPGFNGAIGITSAAVTVLHLTGRRCGVVADHLVSQRAPCSWSGCAGWRRPVALGGAR